MKKGCGGFRVKSNKIPFKQPGGTFDKVKTIGRSLIPGVSTYDSIEQLRKKQNPGWKDYAEVGVNGLTDLATFVGLGLGAKLAKAGYTALKVGNAARAANQMKKAKVATEGARDMWMLNSTGDLLK